MAEQKPLAPIVLVADDNPVGRELVRSMLARLGYEVDLAATGREAVAAVASRTYAAVLMDCVMPEVDGFEATRAIRGDSANSATVIVGMSSAAATERDKCLAAGMSDVVSKPVRLDDLSRVLERRVVRSDAPPSDEIDFAALERLGGLFADGDAAELVSVFLRDTAARVSGIREAVRSGHAKAVEQAAHALRGSVGIFGARRMQNLCEQLEVLAKGGQLDGAAALADALADCYERARPVIARLVAAPPEAPESVARRSP